MAPPGLQAISPLGVAGNDVGDSLVATMTPINTIVAAVVVAVIALIIIAAAVGGYLDGLQAFDALKSAVAR